tara:strand:+ start:27986 stop:29314 length:1329 start_codon:yes stop_codon:yes gene_type:complete
MTLLRQPFIIFDIYTMRRLIPVFFLFICFYNTGYSQNSLQYYLDSAEKSSPLLLKQENNNQIINLDLAQYRAIYKSAKLNLNSNVLFSPILSKDGNTNKLQWLPSGSTSYIGQDLAATNGGQFQALMSINQPLFTNSRFAAQENKASILREQNKNIGQLTKAELQQVVTHQFILCVQVQKQKENTQKIIQIIEDQLQQMKPLVNAGIYKFIDLKLLEIALESSQIDYERLQGEYLNNFNALILLSGIDDTTLYNLDTIDLQLNSLNQKQSLFTSQFKLDSLSVNANQKLFELQYLPQINAFGDAGLNATYNPAPNRLGASIGVSLNWNVFDGHQKQVKREQSQIQLENIETDKKYFENQNSIRKKNILSQMANVDKQLVLINNQIVEYNKLLELYQVEIKQSLVSVLELKTLIKEISMKQDAKTNALMLKEILINSYNYWNL